MKGILSHSQRVEQQSNELPSEAQQTNSMKGIPNQLRFAVRNSDFLLWLNLLALPGSWMPQVALLACSWA